MFLGEKASLLTGDKAWKIKGVRRIKVPSVRVSDGPSGLRKVPDDALEMNANAAEKATYILLCGIYPLAFQSTRFYFHKIKANLFCKMLGKECRVNGVDAILGPGINIKRNPLCGRNFEYYSEDPYVSGKIGAAFIKGVQSMGVGACVKHFACNSQESYRMVNDSIVDERALNEIYLRPFQIAIEDANPWLLMTSYNKINGVYASENADLILGTLKGKWAYDGLVISDWGAVNDPILCHRNGLDVEMPCYRSRQSELMNALRLDRVFQKQVDDTASRIIRLSGRTHDARRKEVEFSPDEAHELAVKAAEKSCVLVKNEGVLPLKTMKGVAVIGELAAVKAITGGGSSMVNALQPISFLDAIRALRPNDDITYSRGYSISGEEDAAGLLLDGVDLASRSKKVILFLGSAGSKDDSEGFDRENLLLSQDQLRLFHNIREVNEQVIVIICSGAPVELPFVDMAKGLFISYFGGEGGGEALARLIMGLSSPSGHLAETWPLRNYEVPSFGIYPGTESISLYRESIYVGYRYYLSAGENARFPFGFGLSYAKFRFSGLKLSTAKYDSNGDLLVSATVTNLSSIPGDALVQIYVSPKENKVFRAKRTLQAFKKVHLEANGKTDVTLVLNRKSFEHYDLQSHSFMVENGVYSIELGESCDDIVAKVNVAVSGGADFASSIDTLHIYYQPPRDGFWQYDDAFESLLGRVIPIGKDPRTKPYTVNSTIEDVHNTWIGKKLISKAKERLEGDEGMLRTFMMMPLRSLRMEGIGDKTIQALVDLANGALFTAFFHLFVRKRNR